MELPKSGDPSDDRKRSNEAHGESKRPYEHKSKIGMNNGFVNAYNSDESPSSMPGVTDMLSEGRRHLRSVSVKRSRTHDCVRGLGLQQAKSPGYKDGPNWRHHHKLVTSVSFPGFEAPLRLHHESQDTSGSGHEIIDSRNLTLQVPFVPCVGKSIPKKRISLRKPRKAIKDLFVHKRYKNENAASPSTPSRVFGDNAPTLRRTRKVVRHRERTAAGIRYNDELSETPSDSSSDCNANVCEDAASLKSFGSQAGCGEIFADDLVSPEGVLSPRCNKVACEPLKQSPTTFGFQGGTECLASPANAEVLDMFGLWETLNRTLLSGQSSKAGLATKSTTPITISPSTTKTANTPQPVESEIKELTVEVITPKSDNQGNTSDEGYCDYVSPGYEDHSRSSLTPVHSNRIPRDTYSGDALYELFCDPSEAEITPIFDDENDLTDSIIGQCSDLPLSMYSFHVGAEENLAPPLARDFVGQELLESKWMGKDCLLKLCDTEISLAMGIVNWLNQRTDRSNPTELRSSLTSGEETGDLCLRRKSKPAMVRKPPRRSRGETTKFKEPSEQGVCVLPSKYDANTVMSTLPSPQSQPNTPTSGVCFRIFNICSPTTPGGDLQSPVVSSPGSGTRSLFVLAINKESLCESCKGSLKNGAKDLHLCRSCMSLIEHIKTSDLWAQSNYPRSTLTPQPITGDLLSPVSTCGIGSDISIASLVEQCASQFSSMKIQFSQTHPSCEVREVIVPEQVAKRNKEYSQKYLKSKHKKRSVAATERGLHARHRLKRSSFSEEVKHSVFKTEGLGFVSTSASNELVLERYNPCTAESGDTDVSQATRPTSLPLVASASYELSCREGLMKMDEGIPAQKTHTLRHRKKSAVNHEGLCSIFPGDRKVERRSRMKK